MILKFYLNSDSSHYKLCESHQLKKTELMKGRKENWILQTLKTTCEHHLTGTEDFSLNVRRIQIIMKKTAGGVKATVNRSPSSNEKSTGLYNETVI